MSITLAAESPCAERRMKTLTLLVLCGTAAVLLVAYPAAASLYLSNVTYFPSPPLVPGGQQHVAAQYTLTPTATCSFYPSGPCTSAPSSTCLYISPGPCTFYGGHELQMQTGLSNARWTIQVVVDGLDTATQTARGSAAFLSSFLLSYSSFHDVSFTVTLDGTVPQAAGPQVTVLQVEEIDNSNQVVPGSVLVSTQPVEVRPETSGQDTVPIPTPPPSPPTVPTARSTGPSLPAAVAGLGLGAPPPQAQGIGPRDPTLLWPRVFLWHNLHLVSQSTLSLCLKALAEVSRW